MILVIIIVVLFVLAVLMMSLDEADLGGMFGVAGLVGSILAVIIWGSSYYSMVDMVAHYDQEIKVFEETIDTYSDNVVDMIQVERDEVVITDFREQGYQVALGEMYKDYRDVVRLYNGYYSKKTILNNNPLWSWLIIMPPERCVPIVFGTLHDE